MLEKVPHTDWKVDRSQVTSLRFERRTREPAIVHPSPLTCFVRGLLGLPPKDPIEVRCVACVPQVRYTVAGGQREYIVWLDADQDDEAEEVAKWLERKPNKFESEGRAE